MELKPTPMTDMCTECGTPGLTLAREVTEYNRVLIDEGKWHVGDLCNTMAGSSAPDDEQVRLFCELCGTYYIVPEELT